MRFGVCTGIEQVALLRSVGYDYIECAVTGVVSWSDREFSEAVRSIEQNGMRCEVCNCFLPGDIRLTGPNPDQEAFRSYARKALARLSELGTETVVFGSGGARRIPDGWERTLGLEQLREVFLWTGEEAARHHITIVIEPLNHNETNVINSVLEGYQMVQIVQHPHIKLLADFYHMQVEGEMMVGVLQASHLIQHIHIANSHGRVFPSDEAEDSYASFFEALSSIGYDLRISVEAGCTDFTADSTRALQVLQRLVETSSQSFRSF